jgi:hypothetical protein
VGRASCPPAGETPAPLREFHQGRVSRKADVDLKASCSSGTTLAFQLAILLLSLALFTAWGLPLAASLRPTLPTALLFSPALGAALLSIVATLLYVYGASARSIGIAALTVSISAALLYRRQLVEIAGVLRRRPIASLCYAGLTLIILSPALTNHPAFTVFQGNPADQFGYWTAAAVQSRLGFDTIQHATPADQLANPLLPVAQGLLFTRPSVNILFATIGALIPGSIAFGAYGFIASFAITGLLAAGGLLLQLFGRTDSAWRASLLAGTYACGFWGQYPIDLNAWSQVAATPLLIAAWALCLDRLAGGSADRPPPSGNGAILPALTLLVAGAVYLYPEGSLFNALILAGVFLFGGRGVRRRSGPVLGAVALGIAPSLLFFRGTLGILASQGQFAAGGRLPGRDFDAFTSGMALSTNQSLQDGFAAAVAQLPSGVVWMPQHLIAYLGGENGGIAALTGANGILGLYFLTPSTYAALTLADAVKAACFVIIALGLVLSAVHAFRTGRRAQRLLGLAGSIGAGGAFLLLTQGDGWSAGKALSYAEPLLCLGLVAPLMATKPSPFAWGAAPWAAAQAGFAVIGLIGLGDPSGSRLPPPYPSFDFPGPKRDIDWDLRPALDRVRTCPLIEIAAPFAYFRQYAEIALYERRQPFFFREPVNAYFGLRNDLGVMATAPIDPQCRLEQHEGANAVDPSLPPASVASFPDGLMAPNLTFAGVSRDGWLGAKAHAILARAGMSDHLHLVGEVPDFSAKIAQGRMRIKVDGRDVALRPERPGSFDLSLPIPPGAGARSIDLEMTGSDTLPPPDGRTVSLKLTSIALELGEESFWNRAFGWITGSAP